MGGWGVEGGGPRRLRSGTGAGLSAHGVLQNEGQVPCMCTGPPSSAALHSFLCRAGNNTTSMCMVHAARCRAPPQFRPPRGPTPTRLSSLPCPTPCICTRNSVLMRRAASLSLSPRALHSASICAAGRGGTRGEAAGRACGERPCGKAHEGWPFPAGTHLLCSTSRPASQGCSPTCLPPFVVRRRLRAIPPTHPHTLGPPTPHLIDEDDGRRLLPRQRKQAAD